MHSQTQVLVSLWCNTPPSWCAGEKTQLHEIGFIYVLQGDRLLIDGGDAEEELVKRYFRPVRMYARPYFLAGGDSEGIR